MKTAISIPDELFAQAEAFVRARGLTRSELFQRAVYEYLESQRTDFVREELNRVYGAESSPLDTSAERAQAEILPPEKW